MSTTTHWWLKPKMTDVGRGKELAQIPYNRRGVIFLLPPYGAKLPRLGAEGAFWLKRKSEGAVEETTEAEVSKAKAKAKAEAAKAKAKVAEAKAATARNDTAEAEKRAGARAAERATPEPKGDG